MKKSVISFIFVLFCIMTTHAQVTHYNLLKSGLSIRKQPSDKSEVIGKIPYGESFTYHNVANNDYDENENTIVVEGMKTMWSKITYKGEVGYVINAYISPFRTPKPETKNLEDYIHQITQPKSDKYEKNYEISIDEVYGRLKTEKRFYRNGAFISNLFGHEFYSSMIYIPELNIYQAFNLLKLIESTEAPFKSNGEIITGKNIFKDYNDINYTWVVTYDEFNNYYPKNIQIFWCEAGCYTIEITYAHDGVIINLSGSV